MPLDVRPELVLFDLDGTLADTLPDLLWALNRSLEEHGLPAGEEARVRNQVSHGARAMTCAVLGDEHPQMETVCQRFLNHYQENVAERTRLFEGMQTVLERLDASGCAAGIVTNKRAAFAEPLIRHLALDPAPRCLVSGDTVSRAKPHPDSLRHAAGLVGIPTSRCAYIGDARNDVVAAQAAGMPVAAARWGYIPHGDDPMNWGADVVLDTPDQILQWLRLSA